MLILIETAACAGGRLKRGQNDARARGDIVSNEYANHEKREKERRSNSYRGRERARGSLKTCQEYRRRCFPFRA